MIAWGCERNANPFIISSLLRIRIFMPWVTGISRTSLVVLQKWAAQKLQFTIRKLTRFSIPVFLSYGCVELGTRKPEKSRRLMLILPTQHAEGWLYSSVWKLKGVLLIHPYIRHLKNKKLWKTNFYFLHTPCHIVAHLSALTEIMLRLGSTPWKQWDSRLVLWISEIG